jgi:hypothetical protein
MIFCKLVVEGVHNWSTCDQEEVMYLKYPHRHLFHIKCYAEVTHDDREKEFIMIKHRVREFFDSNYPKENNLINFQSRSCEMIAKEILDHFPYIVKVEVSEDDENGVIVER